MTPQVERPSVGRYIPGPRASLHGDLSQEAVLISTDRLCLILHKYRQRLSSRGDWLAPAGVLVTIAGTLATTTFNPWLLPQATWHAIFVLTGAICIWLLVRALCKMQADESVEKLVERIKTEANAPSNVNTPPRG